MGKVLVDLYEVFRIIEEEVPAAIHHANQLLELEGAVDYAAVIERALTFRLNALALEKVKQS